MTKLKVLDLFSGIGGFSLGLERTGGFETVAFCEIEPFPRKVLAKHWPGVPIYEDVRKLKGADIGAVDVICGGYPCQPFSAAGKRQGKDDDRHLWPEFMRLVAELRPAWVIGENVAGHISMGLDDVLADLEAEGYACRTFVIPACAVGASHRRDRVWTVANSNGFGRERGEVARPGICSKENSGGEYDGAGFSGNGQAFMADASQFNGDGRGIEKHSRTRQVPQQIGRGNSYRECRGRGAESRMGRMADGFSCWLDEPRERVIAGVSDRAPRLKALGNAVHPDIPMMIGRAILESIAESP
jgi:DNA (cytosine-5)-methyltransferase 1